MIYYIFMSEGNWRLKVNSIQFEKDFLDENLLVLKGGFQFNKNQKKTKISNSKQILRLRFCYN